jgi:uncharacterized membrane protein
LEGMMVVTYKNELAAQANMQTLRKLDRDWIVDIHDAVAVARDADGKLRLRDSYKPSSKAGAGWGVLIGMILGGLALAPLTGGLSTAAAAGAVGAGTAGGATLGGTGAATMASWDKQADGLSEEFVSEVSGTIKHGQSAIFAMVETRDLDAMAAYFRGTSGNIIRATLSPYEQERAQQILTGSQ